MYWLGPASSISYTLLEMPDPLHIDWVTVCDASITELEHAWYVGYWTSNKPMRILLCGGLEDLAAGKSVTDVIEQIVHFKQKVDRQNPRNELVVATLLNPPKYTWFEDNGEPRRNHKPILPLQGLNLFFGAICPLTLASCLFNLAFCLFSVFFTHF